MTEMQVILQSVPCYAIAMRQIKICIVQNVPKSQCNPDTM